MLDLCSGTGSVAAVFRQRGWDVVTVDIESAFLPDVIADVRLWSWQGDAVDFIWASPPCHEFSREFMPWCALGSDPDMSIALACRRVIDECQPTYWVIENVLGAVHWFEPHFGRYRQHVGPFYLWGYFPVMPKKRLIRRRKDSMSSSWAVQRAKIPAALVNDLAEQVERQLDFLGDIDE